MTTEETRLANLEKVVSTLEVTTRKNEGDCEQLWMLWKMEFQERRLGLRSATNRAKLWSVVVSLICSLTVAGIKLFLNV